MLRPPRLLESLAPRGASVQSPASSRHTPWRGARRAAAAPAQAPSRLPPLLATTPGWSCCAGRLTRRRRCPAARCLSCAAPRLPATAAVPRARGRPSRTVCAASRRRRADSGSTASGLARSRPATSRRRWRPTRGDRRVCAVLVPRRLHSAVGVKPGAPPCLAVSAGASARAHPALLLFPHLAQEMSHPAGLNNLGATCYVNAVLQCLFHNTAFRRHVYSLPAHVLEKWTALALLRRVRRGRLAFAHRVRAVVCAVC